MPEVVVLVVIACGAAACLTYGWIEGGWLRRRVVHVELADLPAPLEGLRIAHLSDFHLGARLSLGSRASAEAIAWVAARRPDLVFITGDLVSHPRGETRLRSLLACLDRPFVVLGNHDVAVTRDPFSRAAELRDLEQARLLADDAETVALRGETVSVVGVDPLAYRAGRSRPHEHVKADAGLRILVCHFPAIVDRIPPASFDLILTGHLHAGQICVPLPRRRITLAHPRARFVLGIYHTEAGTMHVSPGTGTSFVPFRFFARPEVTELVLGRAERRI
jgi:predicted MPP superfamily phosphohydrolase